MENWKLIPNTNNRYEISDIGRVRSLKTNKILKNQINTHGYASLTLRIDTNIQINVRIHRLVAEAFMPKGDGVIINHKDGNKLNNYVDNLEWTDYSGNIQHAYDNNLRTFNIDNTVKSGCSHYRCSVTEEIVFKILEIRDRDNIGCRKIAKILDISYGVVNSILIGKTWKESVNKYNKTKNNA